MENKIFKPKKIGSQTEGQVKMFNYLIFLKLLKIFKLSISILSGSPVCFGSMRI